MKVASEERKSFSTQDMAEATHLSRSGSHGGENGKKGIEKCVRYGWLSLFASPELLLVL